MCYACHDLAADLVHYAARYWTPADTKHHITQRGFDPNHWDLPAITRSVNQSIGDSHAELTPEPGDQWSPEDHVLQQRQHGTYDAADFFETVHENPHANHPEAEIPWYGASEPTEADDFPPLWVHPDYTKHVIDGSEQVGWRQRQQMWGGPDWYGDYVKQNKGRLGFRRLAGPWHPQIGIEEYPAMTMRERKQLHNEIVSQGGPPILSDHYHPDYYNGQGDHHYVARGADGTIHGVLTGFRNYRTMEPKKPDQGIRYFQVHDIYTGSDAPKGTGTALMQAAAHRSMRDGAEFGVAGAVHSARPFYHNLGGTTDTVNESSHFDWHPDDRDALAMGRPNRKPVTPIPLDVWDNDSQSYKKHYKMPPRPDEDPAFGAVYVDETKRYRQPAAV